MGQLSANYWHDQDRLQPYLRGQREGKSWICRCVSLIVRRPGLRANCLNLLPDRLLATHKGRREGRDKPGGPKNQSAGILAKHTTTIVHSSSKAVTLAAKRPLRIVLRALKLRA